MRKHGGKQPTTDLAQASCLFALLFRQSQNLKSQKVSSGVAAQADSGLRSGAISNFGQLCCSEKAPSVCTSWQVCTDTSSSLLEQKGRLRLIFALVTGQGCEQRSRGEGSGWVVSLAADGFCCIQIQDSLMPRRSQVCKSSSSSDVDFTFPECSSTLWHVRSPENRDQP